MTGKATKRAILAALARIEATAASPLAGDRSDPYAFQLGRLEMRIALEIETIRKLLAGRP